MRKLTQAQSKESSDRHDLREKHRKNIEQYIKLMAPKLADAIADFLDPYEPIAVDLLPEERGTGDE